VEATPPSLEGAGDANVAGRDLAGAGAVTKRDEGVAATAAAARRLDRELPIAFS